MSQANFAKIEADLIEIKVSTLLKIAGHLNVDATFLLSENTNGPGGPANIREPDLIEIFQKELIIRNKDSEITFLRIQLTAEQEKNDRRDTQIIELKAEIKNRNFIIDLMKKRLSELENKFRSLDSPLTVFSRYHDNAADL